MSSDLDILVVLDDANTRLDPLTFGIPLSADLSFYGAKRLRTMFLTGHLFAWHLFAESKPYFPNQDDHFFSSLGMPAPYLESASEIHRFLDILVESIAGLRTGSDYVFEAGIIHLAMRNLGIIVSYLAAKKPDFSRYAAFNLPGRLAPVIEKADYDNFIRCRHISKRGENIDVPFRDQIENNLANIEVWANTIRSTYEA